MQNAHTRSVRNVQIVSSPLTSAVILQDVPPNRRQTAIPHRRRAAAIMLYLSSISTHTHTHCSECRDKSRKTYVSDTRSGASVTEFSTHCATARSSEITIILL